MPLKIESEHKAPVSVIQSEHFVLKNCEGRPAAHGVARQRRCYGRSRKSSKAGLRRIQTATSMRWAVRADVSLSLPAG